MLHYVHSNLIYNSQELERTQMSFNRGMDTENSVHLHNSAIINNEFMKFLDKLIELENIILSEITQLQKNTHGIHSLMNGFYSQMLQITRIQFTDHMKLNRKRTKVWVL